MRGVVLAGAPGVGKTRLAVEVSRIAAARGDAVAWVRATHSAGAIPLGAFAALLPPPRSKPATGAELLGLARDAVASSAGGRRVVLCVDDAHLLDHGSAMLVRRLAASGEVFVVITAHRDERAPDAVRALLRHERCVLLELEELPRRAVERLLADALGGPVDRLSVGALWEATRGNALFLRELVRYGIERGALAQVGGIWRWRGLLTVGMSLPQLIDARLEELGARERRVLQLAAVAAPLDAGVLEPAERSVIDTLERQGIVERRSAGRRRSVDLAHPLYGEVLRRRLGGARLEAIQRRLADAVEARGARRREDMLRQAAWRLAAGGAARVPGDPGRRVATQLTPREREVALLAATGQSSHQIAHRLVVSVRTVDRHLQHAYSKLGVSRRQDLWRVLTPAAE